MIWFAALGFPSRIILSLEKAIFRTGVDIGQETKQPSEENGLLRKLVATLSLDKAALQDVMSNKFPGQRLMKQVLAYVTARHGCSERQACALTRQDRSNSMETRHSGPAPITPGRRMREIVQTRICYGYRRVQMMLRREGWEVRKNLVYRLYGDEGLYFAERSVRVGVKLISIGGSGSSRSARTGSEA